jgi:hypothetical protein
MKILHKVKAKLLLNKQQFVHVPPTYRQEWPGSLNLLLFALLETRKLEFTPLLCMVYVCIPYESVLSPVIKRLKMSRTFGLAVLTHVYKHDSEARKIEALGHTLVKRH